MKVNYIPGLSYRLFPGTLRNFEPLNGNSFLKTHPYKMVLFTGDAPTNAEMLNIVDFEAYKTLNASKIVFEENGNFKISFDHKKLSRVFQRDPIDTTEYLALCAKQEQDPELENIKSPNSLYAMIYMEDLDPTQNTPNIQNNDLILCVTDVGNTPNSFISVNKTEFVLDEPIVLRNISIAIFQGYTNTDQAIFTEIENPEVPGEMISIPVDTLKSTYINKIWLTKIYESYRDCILPKFSSGDLKIFHSSDNSVNRNLAFCSKRDINGLEIGADLNTTFDSNFIWKHGYLVNESFINLVNLINEKSSSKLFPTIDKFCKYTNPSGNFLGDFIIPSDPSVSYSLPYANYGVQLIYSMMLNPLTNYNAKWWLINELGISQSLVESALASVIPFVNMEKENFLSQFDKDQQLLTVQYNKPIRLGKKYQQIKHNLTNEKLYIYLPRLTKFDLAMESSIYSGTIGNSSGIVYGITYVPNLEKRNTSLCLELTDANEVFDNDSTSTQTRFSIIDYTAISIGLTDNGETDLEFDIIDNIDYIDSFTALLHLENSF